MRRLHLVRVAGAVVVCGALARVAHAADPVLVPPAVAHEEAPIDPRDIHEGAERASVELELSIDRDGSVTASRVTRSAGEALDEAARAAASATTFTPATRDGVAIAARVRYEVVFAARAAPIAEPSTPDDAIESAAPAAPTDPAAFSATARVEAPPREATKRTLARDDLAKIAGTRGDPMRGVELLPGVARPGPNDTMPVLRGAASTDSQVYVEGAPVPILTHVGGFTSFLHSRVLDRVDVYPSGFSVRYGRKDGGVIEARLRDPRTDGFHAIADVSLLDSSALVETPIGKEVSVLAAARRSNIDAVLGAVSPSDFSITAAPVYWDYQAIASYAPTDADRIRLLAYGSSDRLAIDLHHPSDVDPTLRGTFDASDVFHRVQLGYRHRWSSGSEQNTEITFGRTESRGSFGAIGQSHFDIDNVQGRTEWTAVASSAVRVTAGIDVLSSHFSGFYVGVPPTSGEGEPPIALAAEKQVSVGASTWITMPGAYVEMGIRPIKDLLLVPGVRADYDDQIRKGAIDPRLSMRWELSDRWALKGGVGRYSQMPLEYEAVSPIGNPHLSPTHALHTSLGLEEKIADGVTVSVEGFAKWLDGVVTGTPGGAQPVFVNAQSGRVFGGELLVQVKPSGPFYGFLSYTLSRSERRDDGTDWRLFDRDQPHIVAAAASYRLGRGWDLGATFRYASGAPYTPVVASTYEATSDVYVPRAGKLESARNPPFVRLDLRLQKTWTFERWSLAAYLDVQNALNSPNREGYSYNYDYTRREGVSGLPILPILGLRGEL